MYCRKLKRENKKKNNNNDKKEGNNNEDVAIVDDLFVVCDSYIKNVNLWCDEIDCSTYETSDLGLFVWEIMGKLISSEYKILMLKLAMRLL